METDRSEEEAMNGDGGKEGFEKLPGAMDGERGDSLFVWGYLPGASQEKSSFSAPEAVELPENPGLCGDSWRDVCGGGCGFAMAVTGSGKLMTWGSAEDQGLCYLTAGKHEEIPEVFPLSTDSPVVTAAGGWAHCVTATEAGEVYTWGWKECVPAMKPVNELNDMGTPEKDSSKSHCSSLTEANLCSQDDKLPDNKRSGEDTAKRRRVSLPKQESESPGSANETLLLPPCLVTLGHGVKITAVAAGGRHTLALSDVGQVWGWGYGGEGQLGLGTRMKTASSPHLIPCIESSSDRKDQASSRHQGGLNMRRQTLDVPSSYVKQIACGGRHSAVITDSGALLTFGWGLYGQCGNGSTDDELRPMYVSSLLGTKMEGVAAGLWHTVCISAEGRVYVFGGNQFGQLGTGEDQAETLPRQLNNPSLENRHAKAVSCGVRHSAIITDDHSLFCWGWNKYGQLGVGDVVDRNTPSQVSIDGWTPKSVACGWWHTLVLADPCNS